MAVHPSSQSGNSSASPALLPMGHHTGKPPVPLTRPVTVIGSRSSARIHLISSTVSKAHALVVKSNGGVYIRDLASRSHVYVNGRQVQEADLEDGDLIKIGSFTFKFVAGPKLAGEQKSAAAAELDVTGGNFPIPIEQRVILIGRRSADDVVLVEESVSTAHAVIFEMDGERYVRDLGSRTGTFVNGVSTHQHRLLSGDVIRVGETDIQYTPASGPAAIEIASDSATGYALEAPRDEIELPADQHDEHDTIGGLDLVGQIVKDEIDRDAAAPAQPPADQAPQELEPLPLVESAAPSNEVEVVEPPASTDIVDLQDELLGPEPGVEESLSVPDTSAEEPQQPTAEADLHPRRGWRSALDEQAEPQTTQQTQPSEVLRFPEPSPTIDSMDAHDGGTAVLDQDALAPAEEPAFDVADALAPLEEAPPADAVPEPHELKLEFPEPSVPAPPARPASETVDLSGIDLKIDEQEPAQIDVDLPPVAEEPSAGTLDFSTKEAAESIPSALDLDKLTPPPFKLSIEAEALAEATQKLTKRSRKTRKKEEAEAALQQKIEPFVPLEPAESPDPFAGIPPVERFDPFAGLKSTAPADFPTLEPIPEEAPPLDLKAPDEPTEGGEVLEQTSPEPAWARDLDAATEQVGLDDTGTPDAEAHPVDELTDTKFERAVEEFSGDSLGEIVEPEPTEQPTEQPPAAPPSPEVREAETKPIEPETKPIEPTPHADELVVPREPDVPAARRPAQRPLVDPFLMAGANQENFLGGVPLPRSAPPKAKPKTKPVPLNRDPVEELIAEIDSAAAAAERARSELPGAPAGLVGSTEAVAGVQAPSSLQRSRPAGTAPPSRLDEMIPPFAGADAKSGQVTTGFDGLAMPPVRQADVFSAMSPPASEPADAPVANALSHPEQRPEGRGRPLTGAFKVPGDAFFAGGNTARQADQDAAVALAEDSPARRPVRPELPDTAVTGGRPAVMYAGDEEIEFDQVEQKRATRRRVLTLVVIGLALIGGAVGGIYGLLPVQSRIEASIRYLNLDKRTQRERDEIQNDQIRRLRSDYLREAAKRKLLQTPEVSPGFLDDTVQYSRVVDRAYWPEPRNGQRTLVLVSEGANRHTEIARLRAVAGALYDDSKDTLINPRKSVQNAVEQFKRDIAKSERRRDELNGEIASQRILYERKPSSAQVKVLEDKLAALEQAWKRAVSAVKDTEAELDRIKSGADPAGKEAVLPKDSELADMQNELEQLQARVQSVRDASAEKAKEAREKLDDAMAEFQQEIANAREAMSNNPELAAYIAAAQQLQDATRQLIDDLIRRQEQQFNSLMELKQRLNEKMEARRSEMWQADRELQDLTERLAILTRQFNAAVGGGLKAEADELKAQVELTRNMIKARQELIPADPGYAEAIQQLELFVSSTQKDIQEDRKRTDVLLGKLQSGFTSSPQMEKLPAEQKELAARLVTKLESINEARTAYNQSMDAGADGLDPQLLQQITALQAGIEARKKLLADHRAADRAAGQNPELLKQKQEQLDQLKQQAKKAEDEYFASREELDRVRRAVTDASASYEKLEKLESERNEVQTLLKTQNDTLVERQRELGTAVEPQPLTDSDIRITEGADRRPTFAAIAAGALAVLFAGLIGLMWNRAPGDVADQLAPADLRPINHPIPQPNSPSGNGQTAANNSGSSTSEDDHQPAVI